MQQNDTILTLKDFSLSFLSDEVYKKVVENVSFTVNRGKILGIVGESGSGKTVTTLSLIKLLDYPPARIDSGEAVFTDKNGNETNLLDVPEKSLINFRGHRISCIFQTPMTSLNPSIRCGKQVTEALRIHLHKTKEEAYNETIELFKEVGLPRPEHIFKSYPHEISGGQRQRVMIAIAIACHPDIIIADEPTTALDVSVQKRIINLLKSLQQKHNIAVIMISHNLGIIHEIADYVVVMNKGKVVETGTADDIFNRPQCPYTMGLLACRPPLRSRLRHLPTIEDIEACSSKDKNFDVKQYIDSLTIKETEPKKFDKPLLTVENLIIRYPKSHNFFGKTTSYVNAVNDISFIIHEGETLGILGESGCGKSTTANAVAGLLKPTSGKIIFKGTDILSINRKEKKQICREIQMVFQDPYSSLNPKLSVGSILMEPLIVHNILDTTSQRMEKIKYLLDKVGLSQSDFYKYPHEFSGGQRQRICIARALTLDPKLLICDEPVSSLDVSVQAKVLNLLQQLMNEFGLSMMFITHDIAVVNHVSDNLIVMKDGAIIEKGTPFDIINNPKEEYTQNLISSTL
ncbi:MAG: ABC transporter ATP-binding protein [Bacteroidales bacterium]|nr:ABC transporter ATP-binding protein [Bacteroidales bacterium]MBR5651408.1 ABC transporter ATP-binding protein [Bacteroidales bacterium]